MKTKIYKLFLVLFVFANTVNAQNFYYNWADKIGGTGNDIGKSIAIDASGNVYTTGYFKSTVDFDPGAGTFYLNASTTKNDVFVSKLDANGNFIWAKQIGGGVEDDYGYSICLDGSGGVFITGTFAGTADFDPGVSVKNLTSAGGNDIFILKLDTNGNYVWAKRIGDTGSEISYAIATDASGNIYTTGAFQGTTDFDPGNGYYNLTAVANSDAFVCKLDPNGYFLYAVSIGGDGYEYGSSVDIDNSGNVYVTGRFIGTADFDTGAGINSFSSFGGNYDIFVSKFTADLTYTWAKQMGGTGDDFGNSIAIDASGNVYTTGKFSLTADFDPSVNTQELVCAGEIDIFISKLNTSGDFVWVKQIGGTSWDEGLAITTDANNNVYTTGSFRDNVDFDPGTGTYALTSTLSSTSVPTDDIYISKLDADGNFVSAVSLGGTNTDKGNSIFIDQSGNIYLTGDFRNTVDFDPGTNVVDLVASQSDIFILKYSQTLPFVEINVTGNSVTIADGDDTPSITDYTDFGNVGTGSTLTRTFTIQNTGTGTLNLTNNPRVTIAGTGFSLTTDAPATIDAVSSATFAVTFTPNNCSSSTGTISIANDDTDENPYNFSISATGVDYTSPETPTLPPLTNECSITATAPTTTDNCAGTVTGTTSDPLTYNTQGTYTITWTFDDGNGNSTTAEQTVIIDDVTPPIAPTLSTLTNQCSVTATAPTTTDNCAGTITGTACGSTTFSNPGTYILTWTFDDGNGNTATADQTIIIEDNTPPTINCIENQTINLNEGETFYTVQGIEFDPTSTSDNCNIANILNNFNSTTTLANAQLNIGTHTITWIITDKSGNVSICNFQVIVDAFVGIKTLENNGIKIFPNPTSGIVNFEFTNDKILEISVFDITGKQVFKKNIIEKTESIDISGFESGIYIINIQTQNDIFRTKIIKE